MYAKVVDRLLDYPRCRTICFWQTSARRLRLESAKSGRCSGKNKCTFYPVETDCLTGLNPKL